MSFMKAILVIDMPKSCGQCPCVSFKVDKFECQWKYIENPDIVQEWCPLKPMDDYILCKKKQEVVERFPNGMMIVKEVYEPIGEEDVGTM